jgi:2-isopropylmalate synthase
MAPLTLFDSTLRDGAAQPGISFSLAEKLEIASALSEAGVAVLEVATPAASEDEVDAAQRIAAAVPHSSICCITRADPADINVAAAALRAATSPVLHVYIDAAKTRRAHRGPESLQEVELFVETIVAHARNRVERVEFSPVDASRAEPAVLASLLRAALRGGASTINISDTLGVAAPSEIESLFTQTRASLKDDVALSFHGHDDSGRSVDNSLAAVAGGATQIEGTLCGIGPRGGNTDLLAFAAAYAESRRDGSNESAVNLDRLEEIARRVSQLTGRTEP